MNEIYVLGIGCSTFVRVQLAIACGYTIAGLYHYNSDRTGDLDHGYKIIGSFDDLFMLDIKNKYFLLSMGDVKIRKGLYKKITSKGGIVPTLIHPTANISQFATISPNGVLIDSQAIVQSDCIIDEGTFICSQTIVCHQTTVEPYVFIAPQAMVGARLKIGSFSFIGQNATLISTKVKEIGKHAIVGAGAVVTKSVEPYTTVTGCPAAPLTRPSGLGGVKSNGSLLYFLQLSKREERRAA